VRKTMSRCLRLLIRATKRLGLGRRVARTAEVVAVGTTARIGSRLCGRGSDRVRM
jgi:hypothetical protein